MKKTYCILFVVVTILIVMLFAGCSDSDKDDCEAVVRDGYLGEYTDITVSELLDFSYGKLFDNKEWDSGTTDDDKTIVQVKYSNNSNDDSLTIQFTLKSDDIFKITGFVDTTKENMSLSDIMAELNEAYLLSYISKTNIIPNSDIENALLNRLNSIPASAVLFGAKANYEGDRGEICRIYGESPIEVSVTELLDLYGIIDLSLYDFNELPNQNQTNSGEDFSQESINNYDSRYDGILNTYKTALSEQWSLARLEAANLNYLLMYSTNVSDIGYLYMDINGDGVAELFIGQAGHGTRSDFLDLYTLVYGQPVLVASSSEHSMYNICADGTIMLDGSEGAFENYYDYYTILNGSLSLIEELYFNSSSSNTWQYTKDGRTYSYVSDDFASQIIDQYQEIELVYTPFSE